MREQSRTPWRRTADRPRPARARSRSRSRRSVSGEGAGVTGTSAGPVELEAGVARSPRRPCGRDARWRAGSAAARGRSANRQRLVMSAIGPPVRWTLSGLRPGALMKSTLGTSVRRDVLGAEQDHLGHHVVQIGRAERAGEARGRLLVVADADQVDVALAVDLAADRKNTSMRPWPAQSNSSRPPSVKKVCRRLPSSDT